MNSYISNILAQPEALGKAVNTYSPDTFDKTTHQLERGDFDRIVITGMGASYNAAYPAYLQLSNLSIPVMLVNAAELVHYSHGLISSRTLLWLNSQSGRSAELVHLLDKIKPAPPAKIISFVNDISSPLASAANVCQPIYAGIENAVSTKTYLNMMALNLLASLEILGENIAETKNKLLDASKEMDHYLADWQERRDDLDVLLGDFTDLFILGRGTSLSTVWNGALISKEAAKATFEGMHCADFRHGPLELVEPGLIALVLAGPAHTSELNHDLALEIATLGGRSCWLDSRLDAEIPTILIPKANEIALPLVEILPLQMLSLVIADRRGLQAGQFRHIKKVTTRE